MALIEVKVPQLSESVAEATLLAWHKKPGEAVKRDENLIDIETDKVVLELPAPEAGLLTTIVKGDGGTVVSNEVIATIDTVVFGVLGEMFLSSARTLCSTTRSLRFMASSSSTVMCGMIPVRGPNMTKSSIVTLPLSPHCATMMQWRPTTQL